MFTQISPSSADVGETLCSRNFASRVRGIEHGPAKKQSDPAESFKLKQMAYKLRQEEKETSKLNERLQMMQLKYASRENVFKTLQDKIRDTEQACRNYQMKVRDLENQLAHQKKENSQSARDSSKFFKPPLAPIKERQPLSRITNRLPPPRMNAITTMHTSQNKENIMEGKKPTSISQNKARRISLSAVVRSIPVQPKRRASIAILPSQAEKMRDASSTWTTHASQMKVPRRMSVSTLSSLPGTPLATSTPDGKARMLNNFLLSSRKYSSPPNVQPVWRPKIPTNFASGSTPNSSTSCTGNAQASNRLCFSVQKRLIVCSPAAQPRNPMRLSSNIAYQVLRDKQLLGKLGTAQRVVCKNRRQSVI